MSDNIPFNGDAMLMMAWYADVSGHVKWINSSLRGWMCENNLSSMAKQIAGGDKVSIAEFFDNILDQNEGAQRHFGKHIQTLLLRCQRAIDQPPMDTTTESIDDWTAVITYEAKSDDSGLIGAVRAFRLCGFKLNSAQESDRVDLVSVLDIGVSDGKRTLRGFQGQLQEAWLRVHSVMREGTRTTTMGLLGRSMSHNIGSHALWHMELELTRQKAVDQKDRPACEDPVKLRNLISYVRERSEFIAGYATGLPSAPAVHRVIDIVQAFQDNEILRKGIVRSEEVREVVIRYFENHQQQIFEECTLTKDDLLQAILPCGPMSRHALFILLENIVRDAAKYRTNRKPILELELKIDVCQMGDDYLQVSVSVPQAQQPDGFVERIQKAIEELQFVHEDGQLIKENLGIKERFIAAAHLRNRLPSGFLPEPYRHRRELYGRDPMILGNKINPEILWLEDDGGVPVWKFSLLAPKGILILTAKGESPPPVATTIERKELGDSPSEPPANIGQYRFILLTRSAAEYVQHRSERYPCRTYRICKDAEEEPLPSPFIPFSQDRLPRLSPNELRRAQLEHLCRIHALKPPMIVLCDPTFPGEKIVRLGGDPPVVFSPESHFPSMVEELRHTPSDAPLFIIRHHRTPSAQWSHDIVPGCDRDDQWNAAYVVENKFEKKKILAKVICLEFHEAEDTALRSLVDAPRFGGLLSHQWNQRQKDEIEELWLSLAVAACTKILIVDERMDDFINTHIDAGDSINFEDVFRLKGIDFAQVKTKDGQALWEELSTKLNSNRRYDFVVIHLGVLEKMAEALQKGEVPREEQIAMLCQEMEALGSRVIIHSARTTVGVKGRILPYSSVGYWVKTNLPKLHIVEELNNLLREELK